MLSPSASQLEQANARLYPLILQLASATVPLCQPNKRRHPKPAGSAILFRVEQRRYLLTASHVFDPEHPTRPVHAITPGGFVKLSGQRWRTKRVTSQGRPDRTDLAIVPLGDATDDYWSGCRFLALDDIDPFGQSVEVAPATGFLALGFPDTKQPRFVLNGAYAPVAHHFLTHRQPIEKHVGVDVNPDLHIAVGFDSRDFVGVVHVSRLPHPRGMSGGGLWQIADALTSATPKAKLVAVLTEYHEPASLILGTRVSWALSALADLDPASTKVLLDRYPGLGGRAA